MSGTPCAPISTEASQPSGSDNCVETVEKRDRMPPTPSTSTSQSTPPSRMPPTPSPTPPSLLSTPSASPQRGSSPSSNNSSSCPILSEIQTAIKPTNSTPIPITRNSNPSPTP